MGSSRRATEVFDDPALKARGLSFRPPADDDRPFLRELFETARPDAGILAAWPDEVRASFLDQQFHFQTVHYARAYPEADTFDIRRDFRLHVAFGFGIHFCLGAALARMEGKIALEETFKRFKSWTVDKEHSVPLHTSTVRGYQRLPIYV